MREFIDQIARGYYYHKAYSFIRCSNLISNSPICGHLIRYDDGTVYYNFIFEVIRQDKLRYEVNSLCLLVNMEFYL